MELGFFCGAMEEMCVDVDNIERREYGLCSGTRRLRIGRYIILLRLHSPITKTCYAET